MIEWIKDWTGEIIIAVIISIIIEMLVPEGKNKKYIKVVSGIYILYTIVNPFFINNVNFKTEDLQAQIIGNSIVQTNSDSTVVSTYILSLEEYFKERIEKLGYQVKEVKIICNFDYSEILKINIKMKSISYDVNIIKDVILQEYQMDTNNIIVS